MTVAAITPQVEYMEDGISLSFPAPFRYDDPSDLEVARIVDGAANSLVQGVAWSATPGPTDAGGTVTLVSSISGSSLRIRRSTLRNQSTDYQNGDRFPAESHESALDRQMRISQEQDVQLGDVQSRAILAKEGATGLTLDPDGLLDQDILQFSAGRLRRLDRSRFAGQFYAGGVGGILTPASGTGNDPALRADLAAPAGGDLVGFQQEGAGAVVRPSRAKQQDILCPEDFGATANINTPVVALANVTAFNNCHIVAALTGKAVVYRTSTYYVDVSASPILYPSRVTVQGNRATIISITDNKVIACSTSWWASIAPTGRTWIFDVIFEGTGVGASQDGLIIRDYYSKVHGVEVRKCGGRGHVASHTSTTGTSVSGNLVENEWINCRAFDNVGIGMDLGATGNNRTTDGRLINPLVKQATGSTASAISIGSAAGWMIDEVHTYGGAAADTAVVIANAFNTQIGRLYIESFKRRAIRIGAAQQLCHIQSVIAVADDATDAGAAIVSCGRSAAVTRTQVTIGYIGVKQNGSTAIALVGNDNPTSLDIRVAQYEVTGSGASLVTLPKVADANVYHANNLRIQGGVADDDRKGTLSYEGKKLTAGDAIKWSGNAAQSLALTVTKLSTASGGISATNNAIAGILSITAFANDTGTRRCSYVGLLTLKAKAAVNDWRADLIDIVAPSGFSSNPTLAATNVNSANGTDITFTLNFTATSADAFGHLSISFSPITA